MKARYFILILAICSMYGCKIERRLSKKYIKHPTEFCNVANEHCIADNTVTVKDSIVLKDTVIYRDTIIYINLGDTIIRDTVRIYIQNNKTISDTLEIKLYPVKLTAWVDGNKLIGKGQYYTTKLRFVLKNAQKWVNRVEKYYHSKETNQVRKITKRYIPKIMWWLVLILTILCVYGYRKQIVKLFKMLLKVI